MTRKQWINSICDDEAEKIHRTFHKVSRILEGLALHGNFNHPNPKKCDSFADYQNTRRTVVRNFLRTNKLTQRDLNVQYGRLAAGLAINLKAL